MRRNEILTLIDKYNPEIFLLQETWLRPEVPYSIPGYHVVRRDRADGRRRGGVAILLREGLEFQELDTALYSVEGVGVDFFSRKKVIQVLSLYFPPTTTLKRDILLLNNFGPHAFMAGDLNAKHEDWGSPKTDRLGKYVQELCEGGNLNIHVPSEPTRLAPRITIPDAVLDYAITSASIEDVQVLVLGGEGTTSDHLPVLYTVHGTEALSNAPVVRYTTRWDLVRADLDRPWFVTGDVEYDVGHFTSSVQAAILNNSKTIFLKHKSHKLIPKHLKQLVSDKTQALQAYQQTRTPASKRHLNFCKHKLDREMAANRHARLLKDIQSLDDPVLRWQTLNKGRPKPPRVPSLHQGLKKANTAPEKAEMLGEALAARFQEHPTAQDPRVTAEVRDFMSSLPLEVTEAPPTITEEALEAALKTMKLKSAPGPDGITYRLLRDLPVSAKRHLAALFTQICTTGTYPSLWKLASVTMLPKPEKPLNQPSSYRPISLLCCLSKVFEKILLGYMRTEPIPHHQFGFRGGLSTTDQLHRLVHKAAESINRKVSGLIVSLDIEAAFDRVPHPELLYKLHRQSQPAWIVNLLHSYYSNRLFYVQVEGKLSRLYPIKAGTAQGAVISPHLYSLYIADQPNWDERLVDIFQYADDTAYLVVARKTHLANEWLNAQLSALQTWCRDWKTKINPGKSTAIALKRTTKLATINIRYGGEQIPLAPSLKYLGVQIDKNLRFKTHVTRLVSSTKQKTARLMRYFHWRHIVSPKSREILYNTLIRPVIMYGLPAWDNVSDYQFGRLEKQERKWLRIITGLPRNTPKTTLYDLTTHIKTLKQEREDLVCRQFERIAEHPNPLLADCIQCERGDVRDPLERLNTITATYIARRKARERARRRAGRRRLVGAIPTLPP